MTRMGLSRGHVAPGFEPVRTAFEEVVAAQPGTGASFAVWLEGAGGEGTAGDGPGDWVVDLYGGWADAAHTRAWGADTIVMPYSVTKPFAALGVLLLADRGRVDLDAPMQTYWPELRAQTTLRQVLAHRSGLVVLDREAPEEAFYDWDLMCRLLADQEPSWAPGTAQGESALFYGHLLGEVVRRVDGRTLGRFLREELCTPYGLDFHIGLADPELARVADLTGFGPELREDPPTPLYDRALGNPPGALDPAVVNGTPWRRAEVPAVNGHGNARAVAGLYVALQHGLAGRPPVLSAELLAQLRTGADAEEDLVVGGGPRQWGLGVGLDPDGYGMGGVGGSFGWWSDGGRYACAFLTGHIGDYERGNRVESSVRGVLGLPPL
jgi:CubicO group peptidase (beta-lactamase class C family)